MNRQTKAYQQRLAAIRARTAAAAQAQWDQLAAYDQAEVDGFTTNALQIVTAGQMLAGKTSAAYVARRTATKTVPIKTGQITGRAARNADPAEVYRRPFTAVWSALSEGLDHEAAVTRGRNYLGILAATDVWLATRAALTVIDKATPQITSWVRAADGGACDLCSAADGMPMNEAGDMAGHPNCGCTCEPVTIDNPDAQASDPEAVDVQHDDEYGPVLIAA